MSDERLTAEASPVGSMLIPLGWIKSPQGGWEREVGFIYADDEIQILLDAFPNAKIVPPEPEKKEVVEFLSTVQLSTDGVHLILEPCEYAVQDHFGRTPTGRTITITEPGQPTYGELMRVIDDVWGGGMTARIKDIISRVKEPK